jgi:hypothetical protein
MLMTSDSNAYDYVHQIMTWFNTMVGTVSGTHPFFIPLAPDAVQYCAQ